MPRIFDNLDAELRPALDQTLALSHRADFCVILIIGAYGRTSSAAN